MTDNPVDLLLSQPNRLVASTEALVADNAALKAEILENNAKAVQKVTAQGTAIERAFKRAEQTHSETRARAKRTGARGRSGTMARSP